MDYEGLAGCGESAVRDLLVLLLEEGGEAGAIAAAVAFGPDGYPVIVWFVGGEFLEPSLGKVPEGSGGVLGVVGCGELGLGGESSDIKGVALFGNTF